jgi:hypothetical protein
MSSDYIQRLRGELLRAAAAQEARGRRPWQRGDARLGRVGAAGHDAREDAPGARSGGVGAAGHDAREGAPGARSGGGHDAREGAPGARSGGVSAGAPRERGGAAGEASRGAARGRGRAGGEAGRTRTVRRRRPARTVPRLRPLAGLVAVALIVAAVVFTLPRDRADDKPVPPAATVTLDYRTTPAAAGATANVLRARLAAVGVAATVSAAGGKVAVAAPQAAKADVTALMAPGRFAMFYWEGSVLGPDGRPAPGDSEVTGGPDAGRAAALTKTDAEARAQQAADARVVRSETRDDGYFVLGGAAPMTNTAIAGARVAKDDVTGAPVVALDFTEQGQRAFRDLTREVAQGGADHASGGDPLMTSHHFAFVVDDRIVSVPFIDWKINPDGIDGALGAHILTASAEDARRLAAILDAGPLP